MTPFFTAPADGPFTGSGRLVVVSNRVPAPGAPSAGGLAVALDAALKERGGLWFGWSGKTSEDADARPRHVQEAVPVSYAVMDLTQRDLDEYYAGYANRALWPVCHYRLDLTGFARKDTAGYFRVNDLFARRLAPLVHPDDTVWVHDYHFIPMAANLRRMGLSNRIGFFLHIPWPSPDLASVLPAYETIIRSLAAYDLVGFQTPRDATNFAECLTREGIARPVGDGVFETGDRRFRVGAFPIGIETEAFAKAAQDAARHPLVRRMCESLRDRKLIIGVDRLDYSKGIPQRIEAFHCFVESNPGARDRVSYLQITPKSRSEVPEYQAMQTQVAELVGKTNGDFGDIDWVPIRYVNKNVGRSTLAGLYRIARVGLVTPLRDGMNLVAKEYVAAQDADDPGVLILSRFAGAAQDLDGAILVNPYDTEATAGAIARALAMPLEERKERWSAMMASLKENSVDRWRARFLDALADDRALAGEAVPDGTADVGESDDDLLEPAQIGAGRTYRPFGIVKN